MHIKRTVCPLEGGPQTTYSTLCEACLELKFRIVSIVNNQHSSEYNSTLEVLPLFIPSTYKYQRYAIPKRAVFILLSPPVSALIVPLLVLVSVGKILSTGMVTV